MYLVLLEVCDKLPMHWDGWWIPHVCLSGLCASFAIFGGMAGRFVGYLLASAWGVGLVLLELTDWNFPPADIIKELGVATYVLHLAGMLLPLVVMLVVGHARRSTNPAPAGLHV